MAQYNAQGQEIPDPVPVSLPPGVGRPLSLHEEIKRFIRSELSRAAAESEQESFEEADDFEVDEEPDPLSPYELNEAQSEFFDKDAAPPSEPGKTPVEAVDPPSGDSPKAGEEK